MTDKACDLPPSPFSSASGMFLPASGKKDFEKKQPPLPSHLRVDNTVKPTVVLSAGHGKPKPRGRSKSPVGKK